LRRAGTDDVVVGLEVYGDKTHVDLKGRFTLEPWVAALSILNQKTREKWEAQVLLGYITDVKLSSAECGLLNATHVGELTGIKVRNYHRQLSCLLRRVRQIQWGIKMHAAVCHVEEVRNFIFPILSAKGDGKNNDGVCGRYQSFQAGTVDRLCWVCNCPSLETHVPDKRCTWNTQKDIEPLIRDALGLSGCDDATQKHAMSVLKDYATTPVDIAFFHTLNADIVHGIYGMTPIDLMHAFDEGLLPYIQEIFLLRVGGNVRLALLDRLLRRLVRTKRQSGWKGYPKTDFTKGVTNLSNLKACERIGIIFLFALICRSGVGRRHFTDDLEKKRSELHEAAKNSPEKDHFTEYDDLDFLAIDNWAQLFETLCVFHAWTKRDDGFWDFNDPVIRKEKEELAFQSIAEMLRSINGYSPRVKVTEETYTQKMDSKKDAEQAPSEGKAVQTMEQSRIRPVHVRSAKAAATYAETASDVDSSSPVKSTTMVNGNKRNRTEEETADGGQSKKYKVLKRKVLTLIGNGWDISKFHPCLHLPRHISDLGSPLNFNTSPNEKNHKFFAKDPASQSQYRHKVFTMQVAMSTHSQLLANTARSCYRLRDKQTIIRSTSHHDSNNIHVSQMATKFHLEFTGPKVIETVEYDCERFKDFETWSHATQNWKTKSKCHIELHATIIKYLCRAMAAEDIVSVTCATELELPGIGTVRSHPNYQKEGPWEDWVMIEQMYRKKKHMVPAMVCAFITAVDGDVLDEPVAVICRCNVLDKKEDDNFSSTLFTRYSKSYTAHGEPGFDIVDASAIKELRLVFEDTPVLTELQSHWQKEVTNQGWLEDEPPTLLEGIKPALYEWKIPKNTLAEEDAITKDWVYVVRPFHEWMDLFTAATD